MSRFRETVNKSRTTAAKKSSIVNAVIKPFPDYPQEFKDKLWNMLEELYELNGRKYSELSLNEKRLAEMFLKRAYTTRDGKAVPRGEEGEYHLLSMSVYAHRFAVKVLDEWFSVPKFNKLHVIEDVQMCIDDLYGSPAATYNGDPFKAALIGYPDNYLPVRASQGKHEIFAAWQGGKQTDLSTYVYKMRETVVPNEAKFVKPYGLEAIATPSKERPEIFNLWDFHKEGHAVTPSIVAHVVLKREYPDLYIKLYGEEYEFSLEQHVKIKDYDMSREDLKKEIELLRSQL